MNELIEDNTAWRQALRRTMVARREALDEKTHREMSGHIANYLLAALPRPKIVAFCWPIRHEPDVRPVIEHWIELGASSALPVVIKRDAALAFRAWHPASRLLPDQYGIPTPTHGAWLVPDMILIPLNGFDAAGYRLGYGGGYFDRTLSTLQPRPLAVGVGFECNRLASIQPASHDQRLDWIVTEAGAFKVASA